MTTINDLITDSDTLKKITAEKDDLVKKFINEQIWSSKIGIKAQKYEEALQEISNWSDAYPLKIFPEADLKRARELLEVGGITLDSISAGAMRHVIKGVGEIAKKALEDK